MNSSTRNVFLVVLIVIAVAGVGLIVWSQDNLECWRGDGNRLRDEFERGHSDKNRVLHRAGASANGDADQNSA